MGKTARILTGLGLVAGISYFGRKHMSSQELAARGGGLLGYIRGMGKGFYYGVKQAIRFGRA